jgi:hypothetical protein
MKAVHTLLRWKMKLEVVHVSASLTRTHVHRCRGARSTCVPQPLTNHALVLALDRPDAQSAWRRGTDPLTDAADLGQREAMAAGLGGIPR